MAALWAQQDVDRRARRRAEDLWWALRSAFQGYYRRVTTATEGLQISDEVRAVFDLTEDEKAAIEEQPAD